MRIHTSTHTHTQDRRVLVLCNLKARNMRGVKSHGMVRVCLAARVAG